MKRSVAFLLSAILVLSLAGCAQPAETTAPENTEAQTETAALPSSEEAISSETETGTVTSETADPAAESSGAEESTEDPATAESESSSDGTDPSAETSSEESAEATTETPAEETPPAGESSEEPPASSDEAGSECNFADTFRFTAPESWEKQDDGSFTAADGSVRISFCIVPLSDESFSEGIGFRDEDLGSELAAYFSGISEDGVSYSVYDSPSADMFSRTDSGLEYRFLLLRTAENGGYTGTSILSAYEISEEILLVIRFRYAFDSGIAAEQCLEAVNHTIERIP